MRACDIITYYKVYISLVTKNKISFWWQPWIWMSMSISAFTCTVCVLSCLVSCCVFKSGQRFCWLVYERVTPIMTAALPAAWQMVQEGWEQGGGWGVVIYLPIALLPVPVLFVEACLWIIKTHPNLVESCQPCCWCREQSVSPMDCMTDAVCRMETHKILCGDMRCLCCGWLKQLFFHVLQIYS